jgi:hypothetical protein
MSKPMGGDANNELIWRVFNTLADSGLAANGDPAQCAVIVQALIASRESLFFAKAAHHIDNDSTFTRPESLVSHNRFLNSGDFDGLTGGQGQPSEVA